MSYPDTRGIKSNNNESDARDEIGKYLKDGMDDAQVYQKIREKYGDKELINKVYNNYEETLNHIRKKAKKFAQLVLARYSHLGTQRIMEKAKKLKKKYGFTDDEFHAFVNLALGDKNIAKNNIYNVPNTQMSVTLGYTPDAMLGKLSYKMEESKYLSEIMSLHQASLQLHQQIVTQSLMYRDCAPESLTGKFDRAKNNPYNYIHPVIAALFIPRIKYIDEHMLIASISNIVVQRNNSVPIRIQPDWEVFYDMISDPNGQACVGFGGSPMQDLLQRAKLQIELWKAVRDLRSGRYYPSDNDAVGFMAALDQCKSSIFDSPDMAFVKDEGTILRKLMGAFSLRPTIVSITPYSGNMTVNYSMNSYALTQVTSIPIINFRISNIKNSDMVVRLQDSLQQPDMYVENKSIVVKMKEIIYSRDFMVFYVNRRFQNINFARIVAPYNFTMLPTTLSGFETINELQVNSPCVMNVGDDTFVLKSVVMIEKSCFNRDPSRDPVKEIIVGSSAGIIINEDLTQNRLEKTCLIYDPQSAAVKSINETGNYEDRTPITWVPYTDNLYGGNNIEPFDSRISRRGTIYVYVKPEATAYCRQNIC